MKKTIGIDLGTTNSVVAFKTRDVEVLRNRENEELTRSCVALRNDEILVGRPAFNVLAANPENTILSVKRLMGGAISEENVQKMRGFTDDYRYGIVALEGGTDDAVAVLMGGKQYTPEQISAEILKKVKADAEEKLGGEVTHAVITVPAYFTEKQKNATRLAAGYAGLKVLRMLAESTAAAMSYGVDTLKAGELQTVVVYDFGGGTFDVSVLTIVDRQYMEMGAAGDRWLGGDDLDRALRQYVYQQVEKEYVIPNLKKLIDNQQTRKRNRILAELRKEIEEIKIRLSSSTSESLQLADLLEDEDGNTIDIDLTITRAEFEKIIQPFIEKSVTLTEDLLTRMTYTPDMIDAFLLVGGSSCIPLVKQLMVARFGADKVRVGKKPMLSIAEGAAMLAQSLGDTYECPECGHDVPQEATKCPKCGYDVTAEVKERGVGEVTFTAKHNLSIVVTDDVTGKQLPQVLFAQQTPLPAETLKNYRTAADQQRLMKVEIQTDVEKGQPERQGFGFAIIDGNLPEGSEFVFEFNLSADEQLSCKFYPKGFSNKAKPIAIGRGQKDDYAFHAIDKAIYDFNAQGHDVLQRNAFTGELVKLLQQADSIGVENPMDERWSKIGYEVGEIKVSTHDSVDAATFIVETICRSYPQLLGSNEVARLRGLLAQARSQDVFDATQAKEGLSAAAEEYWWMDRLDDMRYVGHHAQRAGSSAGGQLLALHDQAVACFEQGDWDGGFGILTQNVELMQAHWPAAGSGKVVTTILNAKA